MSYSSRAFTTPQISRASGPSAPNQTGSAIPKGTPVRLTSTGMDLVDPGIETQVDSIAGLTKTSVSNGASGDVINSGILEDVIVSFSVGSAVYLGKDGYLTDVKPVQGAAGFVAGDLIVRLGVVSQNPNNPSQKDILVNVQIVGVL